MKVNIHLTLLLVALMRITTSSSQVQPPPERSGIASANGISIAWESFGNQEDEAILLIQGTGAQLKAWPRKFCQQLAAAGYHVIRFDNRDAGLSSKLESLGTPDWAKIFRRIGQCDVPGLP